MSEWQEHRAILYVSARDATLQASIFRLTRQGAVILTDRCVALRCKPDGFLPEAFAARLKPLASSTYPQLMTRPNDFPGIYSRPSPVITILP